MLDDVGRAQAAGAGQQRLYQTGGEVERVDIAAKGAHDVRPQDLDRDILTRSGHARAVHLRNRCRGNGFGKL